MGWWSTSAWLARIGSSRVDASLVALRCLLSVACRRDGDFVHIFHCDGRYSLPHPLIRFFQTSPTYQLSDPSRLQRTDLSVPLHGQSNLTPFSLSTDQSCKPTASQSNLFSLSHTMTRSSSPAAPSPPPYLIVRQFFFIGLLGLPCIHFGIVSANFSSSYGTRAHHRLNSRKNNCTPLDKVLLAIFGTPADGVDVELDELLNRWVDSSLVMLFVWIIVGVVWISLPKSDDLLVRTIPAAETSGW